MGKKEKEIMIKEKNGITLIALVVTIIILIVLATIAINFTFGSNGLINRAESARDMYTNDTVYTEDSILNVESYIDDIITPSQTATTVSEAKRNGLRYKETTLITDDDNIEMYVPGGFKIASDSATKINKGVVITDGTNEFVWIPVSDNDLKDMYNTTDPDSATDIILSQSSLEEETTTTKIYSKLRVRGADSYTEGIPGASGVIIREPDILIDTTYGDASETDINLLKSELGYEGDSVTVLKNFAQDMVEEYRNVYESIKKYDGFYIGRYELTGTAEAPTCQKNQAVLTAATSGANSWYGLKDACNKVINGADKKAKSHMIYGNQWDEVMDWLIDTQAKNEYEVNENSSSWGNYTNSSETNGGLKKSGYSSTWCANNIYDLARQLLGMDTRSI